MCRLFKSLSIHIVVDITGRGNVLPYAFLGASGHPSFTNKRTVALPVLVVNYSCFISTAVLNLVLIFYFGDRHVCSTRVHTGVHTRDV